MRRLLRSAAMFAFQLGFARPVLWSTGTRYRRRGLLPRGPCVVVANHNSHLDAPVLMSLFPVRRLPHVHPVAAADYFGKTWLLRTMAMLFMNGIPIARRPQSGADPLAPIARGIEEGESYIFFPEGSRGEPGVVGPFRPGIGRLVRSVPGLLVVPAYISGVERVWPRGASVPVPLGVDVHVGKPRTYPHDLDAAEIASMVREDVLALAPPPPPVPGPRPSPPVRVAVCAVEPTLRREVLLAVLERLGKLGRTLCLTDPVLEADALGVREASSLPLTGMTRSRAWPSFLAWAFRARGRFRGYKFAEMVERARLDEALEDGRTARFVASEGNALVDLLAWAEADFYSGTFDEAEMKQILNYLSGERRIPLRAWPRFLRKATEVWLLNVLDLARPRAPDVLVLLTLEPAHAMARIRSSGEALEPYENEAFLGRLQEAYKYVAGLLKRRVQTIEIEASSMSAAEAALRVEQVLRRLSPEAKAVAAANGG